MKRIVWSALFWLALVVGVPLLALCALAHVAADIVAEAIAGTWHALNSWRQA